MSVSAISMLAPPPGLVVGLELELPGVDDSIWAAAQICYRSDDGRPRRADATRARRQAAWDGSLVSGLGVRFVAMARSHARMIREFCIEARRKNLGSLLAQIRI